uniref:Uncharacterized protein n=1 Tax=Anguilla anguilla TaxID=7936 RepID=A0A0E9XFV9_ANGAN
MHSISNNCNNSVKVPRSV